jgi:hypothetical protein
MNEDHACECESKDESRFRQLIGLIRDMIDNDTIIIVGLIAYMCINHESLDLGQLIAGGFIGYLGKTKGA